jgi:hypothetical protein
MTFQGGDRPHWYPMVAIDTSVRRYVDRLPLSAVVDQYRCSQLRCLLRGRRIDVPYRHIDTSIRQYAGMPASEGRQVALAGHTRSVLPEADIDVLTYRHIDTSIRLCQYASLLAGSVG